MVSTRLMSSVSNGSAVEASSSGQGTSQDSGPAKFTRHSTVIATLASQSQSQQPAPSTSVIKEVDPNKWNPDQTVFLLDLPQEVIEKIFSFLSFKSVAHLRPVSHEMDRICGLILNSTFQRLQTQMLHRFQNIKSKMPRRESARRNHPLACESDIIETLHMRLTLLQMSFGKHIERRHCCFFPGEILDEVYRILYYIRVTPKLARPYKVTDELFDLSTMAMEYFKEYIEPKLPEIAYFSSDFLDFTTSFSSTGTSKNYLCLESPPQEDNIKEKDHSVHDDTIDQDMSEPIPQSNMVLRKRIRKIKQGMKRYNSQLSLLRQDLRSCKRKTAEQQKQIAEQQKQLAEQQKQTLEYATRLDENDKKNEEISRKFSTLLQELNKCKTELQYWRSKSPATPPVCTGCGNVIVPLPQEDLQALLNQGVMPEGLGIGIAMEAPTQDINFIPIAGTSSGDKIDEELQPEMWNIEESKCVEVSALEEVAQVQQSPPASPSKAASVAKRKLSDEPVETPTCAPDAKKGRRLQKNRCKRAKV